MSRSVEQADVESPSGLAGKPIAEKMESDVSGDDRCASSVEHFKALPPGGQRAPMQVGRALAENSKFSQIYPCQLWRRIVTQLAKERALDIKTKYGSAWS